MSGLRALLIVLPFALVLAWGLPSRGPSRAEVAQALTRLGPEQVASADIRSIDCDRPIASGYDCRWRQRVDGGWQSRRGQFGADAAGWRLIEPAGVH